jgi:hypothetical protein
LSAASILLRSQRWRPSVVSDNSGSWSLKALPVDIGIEPWPIAALTLKNRTVGPEIASRMSARGR